MVAKQVCCLLLQGLFSVVLRFFGIAGDVASLGVDAGAAGESPNDGPGHALMRSILGSYMGRSETSAGYLLPAMSISHVPSWI